MSAASLPIPPSGSPGPAPPGSRPAAMRHFLHSGVTYWGAMLLAGVCNLVFSLIAARHLGPSAYGALAAIIALVNVFLIAATAVTRTATAVVAARDEAGAASWLLRRGTGASLLLGAALLLTVGVLANPLAALLHLQHPFWIWIAGASLVPALAGGLTTGILQGLRAFATSGAVNLAGAVLKLVGLALLLSAGLGIAGAATATLLEVTLIWVAALAILLRAYRGVPSVRPELTGQGRNLLSLPAALTVARLVFFNLDILVARHFLSAQAAGLFAALAVMGRIIAYGTGALPPVVYPYLVRHRADPALASRYLLLCLAATAVAGGGAMGALALAPHALIRVLFGSAFSSISPYVMWYGLAFLCYSLAYVLLHYLLAAETPAVWLYAVGGGAVELAALAVFHAGIGQLTTVELGFFALLLAISAGHVVLLQVRFRHMRPLPAAAAG